MSRNKRIALDFTAGMPAAEIAAREGISLPRVYQIVEKIKRDYHLPKNVSKEELGLALFRRATCEYYYEGNYPTTPAAFYWNNLASP